MRKIAVAMAKGGVGKTTTAVNLAHGLASQGKRVLLVDCDTQGQVAKFLGEKPPYGLYEFITERRDDGQRSAYRGFVEIVRTALVSRCLQRLVEQFGQFAESLYHGYELFRVPLIHQSQLVPPGGVRIRGPRKPDAQSQLPVLSTAGMAIKRSRITVVDCLRGFALFGLFIVHMVEYFELFWYAPEWGWVHDTVFFLFGGKAYAIFALLFGLSFTRIRTTIARGRVIVDNGQLPHLDEEAIRARCAERAARIWQRIK